MIKAEQFADLFRAGQSLEQIGKQFGVSGNTVRYQVLKLAPSDLITTKDCYKCGGPVAVLINAKQPRFSCRDCKRKYVTDFVRSARRADPSIKQTERAKEAEKEGKKYRTADEYRAHCRSVLRHRRMNTFLRRKEHRNRITAEKQWINRLKVELPELYDPTKSRRALVWRARYNLDPEFKANTIARLHKNKTTMMSDDGTLTPSVICELFSVKICPYCGKRMRSADKTLDHIIPRSKGGAHSVTNCLVCCKACNTRKHARTPQQWLMCIEDQRRTSVLLLWSEITNGQIVKWNKSLSMKHQVVSD